MNQFIISRMIGAVMPIGFTNLFYPHNPTDIHSPLEAPFLNRKSIPLFYTPMDTITPQLHQIKFKIFTRINLSVPKAL